MLCSLAVFDQTFYIAESSIDFLPGKRFVSKWIRLFGGTGTNLTRTHTQPPLDYSRDARWKQNTPLNFHMDHNNLTLCEAGKVLRPKTSWFAATDAAVSTSCCCYCYCYCYCWCWCCCCCCCCCCRCCCCCSSSFVTHVTQNSLISSAKVMGCSIQDRALTQWWLSPKVRRKNFLGTSTARKWCTSNMVESWTIHTVPCCWIRSCYTQICLDMSNFVTVGGQKVLYNRKGKRFQSAGCRFCFDRTCEKCQAIYCSQWYFSP